MQRWVGSSISYDDADIEEDYHARLAAFYVNRTRDNLPVTPDSAISRDQARVMIDAAAEALDAIDHAVWLNQRIGTRGLFK